MIESNPPMSENETGMSSGDTTSIAIMASYWLSRKSSFRGDRRVGPSSSSSSSSSSCSCWVCLVRFSSIRRNIAADFCCISVSSSLPSELNVDMM